MKKLIFALGVIVLFGCSNPSESTSKNSSYTSVPVVSTQSVSSTVSSSNNVVSSTSSDEVESNSSTSSDFYFPLV
jgi:uncharacterized lipoprotein NlpE involved in copper resistance